MVAVAFAVHLLNDSCQSRAKASGPDLLLFGAKMSLYFLYKTSGKMPESSLGLPILDFFLVCFL